MTTVEKLVHVRKLVGENKYVLSIASPKPDKVFINIFDNNDNVVHNETQLVDGEFAQVYNLTALKSFTIEVSDKSGVLKKVSY